MLLCHLGVGADTGPCESCVISQGQIV